MQQRRPHFSVPLGLGLEFLGWSLKLGHYENETLVWVLMAAGLVLFLYGAYLWLRDKFRPADGPAQSASPRTGLDLDGGSLTMLDSEIAQQDTAIKGKGAEVFVKGTKIS
jgi:hypothetical protein